MVDPTTIAQIYRNKAARCRRLAQQTTDHEIAERLLEIAREFEKHAEQAENPDE